MIYQILDKINFISPIFYQVIYLTIIGSIVGILIYFIRNIFDRKISGKWKCIMWYIVLIALLIPIRFEIKTNEPIIQNNVINKVENIKNISKYEFVSEIDTEKNNNFSNDNSNSNSESETLSNMEKIYGVSYEDTDNSSLEKVDYNSENQNFNLKDNNSLSNIKKVNSIPVKEVILNIVIPYIWGLGFIIFVIIFFSGLRKISKRVSKDVYKDERLENILRECRIQLNVKRKVKLVLQEYKKVPSIFGIFHPYILITEKTLQEDNETIKYIFLHELSHYKRKDLLFNYILLCTLSIHWFNPVVWFLFKKIRQDIEIGADELASKKLDNSEKKEYGMVLINLLKNRIEENYTASMLCMSDTGKNMERRIHMIKRKSTSAILSIFLLIIIAGVVVGFIFVKGVNVEEIEIPIINISNSDSQNSTNNENEFDFEAINSEAITNDEKSDVSIYVDDICNQFYTYTLPEFSGINNADRFWLYGHLKIKNDGYGIEDDIFTKEEIEEQLKNIFGNELEIDVEKDLPEVDPILNTAEGLGFPGKYSLLISGDMILVKYVISDIKKVDNQYIVQVIEYTNDRDIQKDIEQDTAVYAYEENDNQYMKNWKRIFSSNGMQEPAVKSMVLERKGEFRAFNITLKKDNLGNLGVSEIKQDKKHNENMKNIENQKNEDRRENMPSYIKDRGELEGNSGLTMVNNVYNYEESLLGNDMTWNNSSSLYYKIITNMEDYNKYSSRIDIPKMISIDFEDYFLVVIANENLKPKNEVDLYVYDVTTDNTTTHIIMKQKQNPIVRNTSKNSNNEKSRTYESDNGTFWAIVDKSKLKDNIDVIIEH